MSHRRKSNVREDLVLGNNGIGATNSTNKISNHSTFHADDSRANEGHPRSSRSTGHGWLSGSNNATSMAPSIRGSRASSDAFPQPMSLENDEEPTNEKTATKETKPDSHLRSKSASNHNRDKHSTKEKAKEKRKEKHKDTEKRGKEKETSASNVPEEEHKPKKNKHKRPSPSSTTSTSSMTLVEEPTPKTSEKEKEKDRERIHFRFTPLAQRTTVVAPPPSTTTASSFTPSVPTSSRNAAQQEEASRTSRARRNNASNALRSNSTESTATGSQRRNARNTSPLVLPPPVHHVANRTTTNPPTAAARARQNVNIISPMRPTQRNTSPPVVTQPDPDDDDDFQPDFGEVNDSDEWDDDRRHFYHEEDDDDEDDDDYGERYSYMDAGFDPRHFDTEIDMEDEDIPISSMAPSTVRYPVESSSDDDDNEDDDEEDDDQPKKKKKSSDEESTTQRPSRSVPTTSRPQAASISRFARRNQHQQQQFQPQPDEWNGFTRRSRPRPQAVPTGIPFTVGPVPLPMNGLGSGRGASYHPPLPMSFSRLFGRRPSFEEDTDDEEREVTGSGESLTSSGDSQVDRDAELARQLQMEEARSRGFMYIQPPPMPQPRWRNNRQWGALVNDDDDMPMPPPIVFGDGVLARLSNMFHRRHNHTHAPPGNQSLATNPLLRLSLMTRELTENDYELLLSLDEPVNKGAKKSQISTLPTRVITDDEEVKGCCICLADMEPKSTVKTLPCNHYFHAECIDHWLQVNKVCPIDKKSIDGDEGDADSKTKKS